MRYVLSLLLLSAIVPPAARAQDNDAEKLFRAMEKKIKDANAIQVSADIEIRAIKGRENESKIRDGVSKGKAALLLTKDNQARLKISNEYMGMTLISDGKRLKVGNDRGDLGEVKALPTPTHLHNLLNVLVRRVGVTTGSMIARFAPGPQFKAIFLAPGEKDFDAEKVEGWGVWDFKAGAATKIGGQEAKAISYMVGPKGDKDSVAVTLWLDAKTLLPLKSIVVIRLENMHITETYREFKLDPMIEAKAFTLVPQVNDAEKLFRAVEKKINTAKAVQVTVEYAAKTKGKEEKLKGSLLFTKNNQARLKMKVPEDGKKAIEMISDGKRMKVAYPPEDTLAKVEALGTPAVLHKLFGTMVSGPGLLLTYDLLNVPEWFDKGGQYTGPGRWPFRIVDFETSAATKVGGRNTKVITYRVLELPGGDWSITLFVDAETMLPVQRVLAAEGKDGPVRITETCTFDLNPKVDAGAFVLPK